MEHSLKVWILLINSQNLFKYYFWILIPSYSKFSFVVVASWLPRGKCQKNLKKDCEAAFTPNEVLPRKLAMSWQLCGGLGSTYVRRQVVWLTVRWCQISGKSNWQLQCDADTGEQKGDLGLTSGAVQVCSESHWQMRWQPSQLFNVNTASVFWNSFILSNTWARQRGFYSNLTISRAKSSIQLTTFTIKTVWIVIICDKFPF